MKTNTLHALIAVILFLMPTIDFGQSPNLGVTSSFALFTAAGAFNNIGASTVVTGDVGTNAGAFNAFPPGTLVGQQHNADAISAQAAIDVAIAYSDLFGLTCGTVIGTTLGSGQVLMPDIYCLGGASTLNGELILDAAGNSNAVFVFKIDGALSTTVLSSITLINSASLCNVFFQVNGAVALGEGSVFRGTIIANGAISILTGATLIGRGLSTAGAISLQENIVSVGMNPLASTVTANGPTTFCAGESVTLSGNIDGIWSTGETTASITVNTSGDYFVTNTNSCGSINSNHIIVTVNPLPNAITGSNAIICNTRSNSTSITLGAAEIAGNTYLWSPSSGLSSTTIANPVASPFVTTTYTLTETITGTGCQKSNTVTVTVIPFPNCAISGNSTICPGQSTQLCAPIGSSSYLWSTGAVTNCITVNSAGNYFITVTNSNGCSSKCSKIIAYTPTCSITGSNIICQGTSTSLTAASGAGYTYLWSTGAKTSVIIVKNAGTYSVTVTKGACSNICSITVTVVPLPSCAISGNLSFCQGQTTLLCAPVGYSGYLWSTGATTNCITVSVAGSYSVTVTNANGCKSMCCKTVTLKLLPNCKITGNLRPNPGKNTTLCVTSGMLYYKWNTGATNCCITVNSSGTYTVTVTGLNLCTSTCSATVTYYSSGSISRNHADHDGIQMDDGNIEVNVYPNPFKSKAILAFQNTKSNSHVLIEIYNSKGNKIATLFDNDIEQGALYNTELNAENLVEGIYIYRIFNGNHVTNGKLILMR